MSYTDTQLHIDGKWQAAADGRTLAVVDPASGLEIGRVARASAHDLSAAVEAAVKGFDTWRGTPAIERGRIMRRAAVLLRERADSIGSLITHEQGKPFAEARGEVIGSADVLEWFADEAMRIYGRIVPARTNAPVRHNVLKEPVGPVAAFTPWNFPVYQLVRKVGPALSAGCSIVVKAPEETPASPAALLQAFVDAGIPPGVFQMVFGEPAKISEYLIPHPAIRKISFTGSTAVGKHLAALAGRHMKRFTMELGGHAPVIIAADADVQLAIRSVAAVKFRNAGQACIAPTRFLVHEGAHDEFVAALSGYAQGLKVGHGHTEGIQMGPLANSRRLAAMEEMTRDAVGKGAAVVTGGKRFGDGGNFWNPTVLTDVSPDARVFNDEPFGPIAAVRRFKDMEEAIVEANRLSYGLAAYAFTSSLKNVDLLSRRVEVGMLWINTPPMASGEMPFGGVKDSGIGTEGGPEALDAYLDVRAVTVGYV